MSKGVIIGSVALVVVAAAVYFGVGLLAPGVEGQAPVATAAVGSASTSGNATDPNQPSRPADIKGTVLGVDGTSVTIDRLLFDDSAELTEEEKAAKKAERQQMTMEERQAAKAAEREGVATERVTIEIPVGVAMVRMNSDTGEPTPLPATLADIKTGSSVTVWTQGDSVEYVKIQAGG